MIQFPQEVIHWMRGELEDGPFATEDRWPPTYDELGATFPSRHLRWSQSEIARTLSSAFAVDVLFPQATSPDD